VFESLHSDQLISDFPRDFALPIAFTVETVIQQDPCTAEDIESGALDRSYPQPLLQLDEIILGLGIPLRHHGGGNL
jgi:hypothetical protein